MKSVSLHLAGALTSIRVMHGRRETTARLLRTGVEDVRCKSDWIVYRVLSEGQNILYTSMIKTVGCELHIIRWQKKNVN